MASVLDSIRNATRSKPLISTDMYGWGYSGDPENDARVTESIKQYTPARVGVDMVYDFIEKGSRLGEKALQPEAFYPSQDEDIGQVVKDTTNSALRPAVVGLTTLGLAGGKIGQSLYGKAKDALTTTVPAIEKMLARREVKALPTAVEDVVRPKGLGKDIAQFTQKPAPEIHSPEYYQDEIKKIEELSAAISNMSKPQDIKWSALKEPKTVEEAMQQYIDQNKIPSQVEKIKADPSYLGSGPKTFAEFTEADKQLTKKLAAGEIDKSEHKAMSDELWDAYQNYKAPTAGPPKPIVEEPPVVEKGRGHKGKSRRVIYEDDFIGPPDPVRDLPMDRASVEQRMAEQDYSPRLYSGIKYSQTETPIYGYRDPLTEGKGFEPAIFSSLKPKIANEYAHEGTVIPMRMRMENPYIVDWAEHSPHGDFYTRAAMEDIIATAKELGHGTAVVKNIVDLGGRQDQYLAFNPNQIRSEFARFDPMLKDSRNLLAGGAGAGVATKALSDWIDEDRKSRM